MEIIVYNILKEKQREHDELQKRKIYKILNTIDDNVYVGSTTEPLCKRMWKHKWDVKNNKFITRPFYVKAK